MRPVVGGVLGLLESAGPGNGGEDLGDDAGLLLLELVVVMVLVKAGVVVVTMFPDEVDTTKLSGDDRAISSCGSGSLSIAAKLLGISCGDACLLRWLSSLSFSVKPCNYGRFTSYPCLTTVRASNNRSVAKTALV